MKIGFLGCGKMANAMAKLINGLEDCELYACAARDLEKAKTFKENNHFEVAYGSYEEMVEDPKVELVYISVVTKAHKEAIKLCLNHNKHVLCEKPFCVNSIESSEVIELAKKKHLYLAEAMWTRYMESRKKISEIIDSNKIGKPYLYVASIGYKINNNERMQDPMGGGVLLDCGVYPLNFVFMNVKEKLISIDASTVLTKTGVDDTDIITLHFEHDVTALIYCTMNSNIDCSAFIYGDNGYIKLDHVNHPKNIEAYTNDRPPVLSESFSFNPPRVGYEYQWNESIKMIKEGKTEAPSMSLEETQKIMEVLDAIRKKSGIKFQDER